MADVKALVDFSTEQTTVADADLMYVASSGTPAKITWGNLRTAMQLVSASDMRFLDTNGDEIFALFDEGGGKLSYRGSERLLAGQLGVYIMGNLQPYTIASGEIGFSGITPSWSQQTGFNSTITRASAGTYDVTFDSEEADANYIVQATIRGNFYFIRITNELTTGFRIRVADSSVTDADPVGIFVTVTRIT